MNLNGFRPEVVAEAFYPHKLHLIALSTEKCNFRCSYCYEDFAIGRMRPWVVDAIKQLIDRRLSLGLKELTLDWFGGEPLLAADICIDVSRYASQKCKSLGAQFGGGFTTNGYLLTPHLARELAEIGVATFQITLDGAQRAHDATRVLANGGPTFDRIWSNLKSLSATRISFQITLRLHVSPSNEESLCELLGMINEHFGKDDRFDIHFHRISDLGGPKAGMFETLSMAEYRAALGRLKAKSQPRTSSEVDLLESREICYAAKPNSILIRADGRLGKCTVALNDARNNIGRIRPDGTLDLDNAVLHDWFAGFESMNPAVLGCPLEGLPPRAQPHAIPFQLTD